MTDDRRSYLGGPGAAAVLGVNPYSTPVAEWLRLTGRAAPVEVSDVMRSGQRLEPVVLQFAGEEIGRRVMPGPFIRDAKLTMAAGHLDGITEGEPEIVEAKTSRTRNGWGEPGTGEVPPHIAAQCEWYLGLVPEARVCWVPVLFSGLDFALYKVERDDRLIEQMRNVCWRWWQDYVLTDTPPPPQTGADATLIFPRSSEAVVIADDATRECVAQLRELKTLAKEIEGKIEDREGRIKLALGEASVLSDGSETLATWRSTKPSLRFDQTAFKLEHPDEYRRYCRESSSRRFLLK